MDEKSKCKYNGVLNILVLRCLKIYIMLHIPVLLFYFFTFINK